ncbi:MAG: translation elongation factor Ts [Coriobacteriales bacterium]|jgi:elongation factor Ts
MAQITAALVKQLREMTSVGMMECKKALVEADGDIDKAVDILRTHGLAAAAKKAGRATNEGTVIVKVNDDHTVGAILELNCETDFVGTNEVFLGYADRICTAVLENDAADVDALKKCSLDGETVEDILNDAIHKLGENMQIARFKKVESDGYIASYIHMGGKIGIIVDYAIGNKATGDNPEFIQFSKDVAMQVAAMNPVSVSRDTVPDDVKAHEMEIYKAQAAESGKPENIQEKIATGRMEKFYKENCLLEEAFVKDNDKTVGQLMGEVAKAVGDTIDVNSFVRFVLGEAE